MLGLDGDRGLGRAVGKALRTQDLQVVALVGAIPQRQGVARAELGRGVVQVVPWPHGARGGQGQRGEEQERQDQPACHTVSFSWVSRAHQPQASWTSVSDCCRGRKSEGSRTITSPMRAWTAASRCCWTAVASSQSAAYCWTVTPVCSFMGWAPQEVVRDAERVPVRGQGYTS